MSLTSMDKLNTKQQSFVINYIKNGFNGYQAMIESGYSHSHARTYVGKLIDHPLINKQIKEAYQSVQLKRFKEVCMSISERVEILDRIIREIVPKDKNEPIKHKYMKEAMQAIDMLTKMSGDYAPDRRLSITVDATQERLNEAKRIYDEY